MAKVIVGLLTIMLVASLVSGCYQAPAPAIAPAPTSVPIPPEAAPAPVLTPTEQVLVPAPVPTPTEKTPAPALTSVLTPTEQVPVPAPVLTPTEKTPAPAAFTSGNLTISPAEVDSGKSVTISVVVSNTGGLTGSYKVTLKIDNIAVTSQDVTLTGGAGQTVTFVTTKEVAGTHTVNIDSLSGTFTVKATPAPVGSTVYQATIKDFTFSPNQITIKVGDTVIWTNQDSVSHTVTGSGLDSGNLASGRSWSYTFKVAGTFTYHCSIHPSMQGQVSMGSGSQSSG